MDWWLRAGAGLVALQLLCCTGRPALPGAGEPVPEADGSQPRDLGSSDSSFPSDMNAGLAWVTLPAGSFHMGSPTAELCRLTNEEQHPVTLSRSFQIGATEVTQASFLALMGYNPSHFASCGLQCPVDSVDWSTAVVFCNRLSEKNGLPKCYGCVGEGGKYSFPFDCTVRSEYSGKLGQKTIYDCPGYRLPTEGEWEYAYRAGTSTALFNGPIASCHIDGHAGSIAWYDQNSGDRPHQVAGRQPNTWGLFDMAGNLWEWVQDWYQPDLGSDAVIDPFGPVSGKGKVLRGGAWMGGPGSLRAASRNQNLPVKGLSFVGFRCARTILP